MAKQRRSGQAMPDSVLEWIAAGVGLLLAAAMVGLIGWEAASGGGQQPPALMVEPQRAVRAGGGYVVEFVARNRSEATAAAVRIEGQLKQGGEDVETSEATLAYVPGRSQREGGLVFARDPRLYRLELRATGYQVP